MSDLIESLLKCKVNGNVLSLPPMSEGPLANYAEVRKALLNAGASYKKKTFIFPSLAQPFIDRLTNGESVNIKKEFQFFATPDDIADWLVELAELRESDLILEPSAGQGAILKAINKVLPGKIVLCVELMPENRTVLESMATANLMDIDFLNLESAVALSTKFTKIIANPPFSKNQDIDHIYQMYKCLKTGGRIVTVASKHWQNSSNKKEKEFRGWLSELDAEIHEIKAGAFKSSGTMISSVVIIIDKA